MKVATISISPSKNRNLNTNHSDFMQIPSFKADRFDGFLYLTVP